MRRTVHLHATGDLYVDSIRIEQNDLLLAVPADVDIYRAVLRCLVDSDDQWDELDLQGIAVPDLWVEAARPYGLLVDRDSQPAPRILFERIKSGEKLWQSIADKKSRYTLRRALDDYSSQIGPLRVAEPGDASEAIAYLGGLAALHKARWQSQGIDSDFVSPRVQCFHKKLTAGGFNNRRVRIFHVLAGSSTVGYVYLLIHDGVANFYQSGFNFKLLPKNNQPGWACLQMVIEKLRLEGFHSFEFLAGDEGYKRRLANVFDRRIWLKLTRPSIRFRLEKLVIRAVVAIRKLRSYVKQKSVTI